ncbi:MAG TPA: LysM peptidoglycan-binding domain-containing protein [Tepidisphaeraceae bacterium]|nr:LysM peptidoglycan-binding domain-containing protein [Tepidisphaeraceae bacterium]
MKRFIAFAVVTALVIVGCAKKTATPAANSSITEVAPPPPIHNGITQAAPISTTYADPIVSPADDITPSRSTPAGGGKTYVVKKGDTLWAIAQRTYGDGKQYRKIVAANPNIKGDRVFAGQKIVLPI